MSRNVVLAIGSSWAPFTSLSDNFLEAHTHVCVDAAEAPLSDTWQTHVFTGGSVASDGVSVLRLSAVYDAWFNSRVHLLWVKTKTRLFPFCITSKRAACSWQSLQPTSCLFSVIKGHVWCLAWPFTSQIPCLKSAVAHCFSTQMLFNRSLIYIAWIFTDKLRHSNAK